MADKLTPDALADMLSAYIPPESVSVVATPQMTSLSTSPISTTTTTIPTLTTSDGVNTMDQFTSSFKELSDSFNRNTKLKYAVMVAGGIFLVLVVGGVAYHMYNEDRKKERALRLALVAEEQKRKRKNEQDITNNNNGKTMMGENVMTIEKGVLNRDSISSLSDRRGRRTTSGDDDSENIDAYDEKYKNTTYGVL